MVSQLLRVFALFVVLACTKSEHLNNILVLFRLPSKENPQSKYVTEFGNVTGWGFSFLAKSRKIHFKC